MLPISLRSDSSRLFLVSFLTLFLELVCIRWLSSYILYLGYFTNFVLLGCLLGIGIGALIAEYRVRFIRWLPLLLFVFLSIILFTRAQVNPAFEDFIYFTSSQSVVELPAYVLLPMIFIGVTAIFAFLSQDLGVLLTKFPPLKAYNVNILGSLVGIAVFTLLGYLALPAWVWFVGIGLALIPLLPTGRSLGNNLVLLLGLVAVIAASDYAYGNLWSPYYRLGLLSVEGSTVRRVMPYAGETGSQRYILSANGVRHQEFTKNEQNDPLYLLPYRVFAGKPEFKNALVIGAGGGNDVAFALANGVQHIDAVEIDPRIAELGTVYHPEHPYSNPRVSVYIDDARAFLKKTNTRYDLVIFALPNSLVLAANTSNLRLESYLFTVECFQSVKAHLEPDGFFVLYNFYRYDWLIDKIAGMLALVFDEQPVVYRPEGSLYTAYKFAAFFTGPRSQEIDLHQAG